METFGKVVYSYVAQEIDELSANVGQELVLLHLNDDGWYMASMDETIGLFPGNYVEEIPYHSDGVTKEGMSSEIETKTEINGEMDEVHLKNMNDLQKMMNQRIHENDKMNFIRNSLSQMLPENKISFIPTNSNSSANNINNSNSNSSSSSKESRLINKTLPKDISTITHLSHSRSSSSSSSNNNKLRGKGVEVVQGIRYQPCKSIVYSPSSYLPIPSIPSASSVIIPSLQMEHIYGYKWERENISTSIHNNNINSNHSSNHFYSKNIGKSILISNQGHIIYPAGSVIVIMKSSNSQKQRYFTEHNAKITCLAMHPTGSFVASGQVGKKGLICIWNVNSILSIKAKKFPTIKLYTNHCLSHETTTLSKTKVKVNLKEDGKGSGSNMMMEGISSLDFSGDGKLLLTVSETYQVIIFDWVMSLEVIRTELGHSVLSDIRFNPISYSIYESSSSSHDFNSHYTIVSTGGDTIKFWTIKSSSLLLSTITDKSLTITATDQIDKNKKRPIKSGSITHSLSSPSTSSHLLSKNKNKETYEILGALGNIPKNHGLESAEFMHLEFIKQTASYNNTNNNDDSNNNSNNNSTSSSSSNLSLILTSTSTGAIYIWEQLFNTIPATENHPSPSFSNQKIWTTKSRLISVVLDMHTTFIEKILSFSLKAAIDYEENTKNDDPSEVIVCCTTDGEISLWNLNRSMENPSSITLTKSSIPTIRLVSRKEDETIKELEDNSHRMISSGYTSKEEILSNNSLQTTDNWKNKNKNVSYVMDILWDEKSEMLIIGTSSGSVCKLSMNTNNNIDSMINMIISESSSINTFETLITGHCGAIDYIRSISNHPNNKYADLFASVSSEEGCVKIWDSLSMTMLIEIIIPNWKPTCIAFVPNISNSETIETTKDTNDVMIEEEDMSVIIGNNDGEIALVVLTIQNHGSNNNTNTNKADTMNKVTIDPNYRILAKKKIISKSMSKPKSFGLSILPSILPHIENLEKIHQSNHSNTSADTNASDMRYPVSIMKFSSDGKYFAVVCKNDKGIHILSTENQYKRIAVCKGHSHTSTIAAFDISSDSKYIQANDKNNEILYWELSSGKLISDAYSLRDCVWDSWTLPYGWPVQGLVSDHHHHHSHHRNLHHRVDSHGKKSGPSLGLEEDNHTNETIGIVQRSPKCNLIVASYTTTTTTNKTHTYSDNNHDSFKVFPFPATHPTNTSAGMSDYEDYDPGDSYHPYHQHKSIITGIIFVGENSDRIITSGNDGCLFQWKVVS